MRCTYILWRYVWLPTAEGRRSENPVNWILTKKRRRTYNILRVHYYTVLHYVRRPLQLGCFANKNYARTEKKSSFRVMRTYTYLRRGKKVRTGKLVIINRVCSGLIKKNHSPSSQHSQSYKKKRRRKKVIYYSFFFYLYNILLPINVKFR